jgi:hypothetical protein
LPVAEKQFPQYFCGCWELFFFKLLCTYFTISRGTLFGKHCPILYDITAPKMHGVNLHHRKNLTSHVIAYDLVNAAIAAKAVVS